MVSRSELAYQYSHDTKRWYGAAGVDKVKAGSDIADTEFGLKYGVLIKERCYLRRSVFFYLFAHAGYRTRL